ncbi:hypothetical protein BJ742DRAFT_764545 [Cladochytrium replicatum]|nr:hypothetical protein BJ742DRAFT_764545 [Cladochytrium replicatum]
MVWKISDIPNLSGKVAIVTGGSSGIGLKTALELARKGAHIFVAARNERKTLAVVEDIKKETGNHNVEFGHLNLLSLKSVDKFASDFLARGLPLHILVNNAGVMFAPFELSEDGIESQFATNHLAHFHLTTRLLEKIAETGKKDGDARIVNVSSSLHRAAPKEGVYLTLEKLNDSKIYNPQTGYGQSKVANILFTRHLDNIIQSKYPPETYHVYANVLHPGVIRTELARHVTLPKFFLDVYYWFNPNVISVEDGATTQLFLSTSPEIKDKNIHGEFYIPIAQKSQSSAIGQDKQLAEKLWVFSEQLVKEKLDVNASL